MMFVRTNQNMNNLLHIKQTSTYFIDHHPFVPLLQSICRILETVCLLKFSNILHCYRITNAE